MVPTRPRTRRMITIEFPMPCKPLTMNQRMHWAQKAKATKAWREASYIAAWKFDGSWRPPQLPRSIVQLDIPVRSTKVRRDPHNWYPTVKAVIDGLVDAGLWPDDNSDYVATTEPKFHQGGATVYVTITPIEPS